MLFQTPMQPEIHLKLMKLLEKNPQQTQRELARQLGISLGKTNYCLKSLKEKGWLKWGNFSTNPNKFQNMHLLTPKGASEKIALTIHFLKRKEKEYELLKEELRTCTMSCHHSSGYKTPSLLSFCRSMSSILKFANGH